MHKTLRVIHGNCKRSIIVVVDMNEFECSAHYGWICVCVQHETRWPTVDVVYVRCTTTVTVL